MIGIIDYGLGNLASVANALIKLKVASLVSNNIEKLKNADALIFPGVGAAGQAMKNLRENGLDKFIKKQAEKGVSVLGICLGMQLMFDESEEGRVKCLGLIRGKVKRFKTGLKVPQIGWNQMQVQGRAGQELKDQKQKLKMKSLFNEIPDNSYFYFVNSYYCEPAESTVIAGITDYGNKFCSIAVKDNLIGMQFHPEKSGDIGLKLLKNFIKIALK